MGRLVTVARTTDIPEGDAVGVEIGGERVAVFRYQGRFYAVSDVCPHAGGPLSQGWAEDGRVTCPWHGWTFDIAPAEGAPDDGLKRYRVEVDGDQVKVEAPD